MRQKLGIKSSAGLTEMGITRKRKMHLGVVRRTTGLPLCSLSSHSSHNPPPSLSLPLPATTAEWNLNTGITPSSSCLLPSASHTLPKERVWEDEVREPGSHPSIQSLFFLCHSTPLDNESRVHSYRSLHNVTVHWGRVPREERHLLLR